MAQQVQITLDSEQVMAIADQIEKDNKQLKELLEATRDTIESLSSTWTGQAADETRASYTAFSKKYFDNYYDVLDQYVKFLIANVSEQYSYTEHTNTSIADAFK